MGWVNFCLIFSIKVANKIDNLIACAVIFPIITLHGKVLMDLLVNLICKETLYSTVMSLTYEVSTDKYSFPLGI